MLLVTFAVSSPLHALQAFLGRQVAANFADLTGSAARDASGSIGGSAGVFVAFPVRGIVVVQIDALYSLRRTAVGLQEIESQRIFTSWFESVTRRVTAGYVEVPVTIGPAFSVGRALLRPEGGASLAMRFHCDLGSDVTIGSVGSGSDTYHTSRSCTEDLKPTDVGLVLGLGVILPLGPGQISLAARYTSGLSTAYSGVCTGLTIGGQPGCVDDVGFDGRYRVLSVALGLRHKL